MNRRIALLLCAVMLLSMVLTGCTKTVDVIADLSNMELRGEATTKTGEDYIAILEADEDYVLPEEITVNVDGAKLSAKKYTYNPDTGDLLIPGDMITGEIEIIGEAPELTVVGQWKGPMDLTDAVNQSLAAADATLAQYLTFSDLTLDFILVLNEDGTCTFGVDTASAEKLSENMKSQLVAGGTEYLNDLLAGMGYSYTAQEFLGMQGYTVESYLSGVINTDALVQNLAGISISGKYVAEDDVLYISDSMDQDPKSSEGIEIVLTANTLTLKMPDDSAVSSFLASDLVMERVG